MPTFLLLSMLAAGSGSDTAFASIVLEQVRRYPLLTQVDLYKLAHQAAFGAEHAIPDSAMAAAWLEREWEALPDRPEAVYDTIAPGGTLVRLNLRAWRDQGGRPDEVLAAFLETGRSVERRPEVFERYWATIVGLARVHRIPFDADALRRHGTTMRTRGYPAASHSPGYRAAYQPAYRVVRPELVRRFRRLGVSRLYMGAVMSKRQDLITFFEDYEASLNSAILCDAPGATNAATAFGEEFVNGNEAGVECRRNDEHFVSAIIATCEAYRRIGIRALRLEGIDSTPIDQDHVMARVHWLGEYRGADGTDIPVPFDSVYFVRITGPMKIFGRITGDEQRALKRHGLSAR